MFHKLSSKKVVFYSLSIKHHYEHKIFAGSTPTALNHSLYLSFFRIFRYIFLFPILHEDFQVLYINDTITEGSGTDITE